MDNWLRQERETPFRPRSTLGKERGAKHSPRQKKKDWSCSKTGASKAINTSCFKELRSIIFVRQWFYSYPLFRHILNGAARDILFRTENMRAKSDKKPKREELRGDKQAKKDESMKGEQRGIKAEGLSYKVGPTLPIITSSSERLGRHPTGKAHACMYLLD